MNKRPNINPSMQRMLAYSEGRQAFEEKRWRAFNPYKEINKNLASDWLSGWEQAKEESDVKARHVTVDGNH